MVPVPHMNGIENSRFDSGSSRKKDLVPVLKIPNWFWVNLD
jgi:hypothetical protein